MSLKDGLTFSILKSRYNNSRYVDTIYILIGEHGKNYVRPRDFIGPQHQSKVLYDTMNVSSIASRTFPLLQYRLGLHHCRYITLLYSVRIAIARTINKNHGARQHPGHSFLRQHRSVLSQIVIGNGFYFG